ncbi:putative phage metallopeptidase domain-containing protein [Candidatus Magnetomoraceae bacterium gMMP-15]
MGRFINIDEGTQAVVKEVIQGDFSHLVQAKIKVLFDTRKRKSIGKYVLGKLQKTNDLLRHLTSVETGDAEGYDYLLYLDERVFESIDRIDKIRLIRHLLQYADIDYEADIPYKIRKEEVVTWYDELEFNKEDPRWYERLETIAESLYNSEDETPVEI